MARAQVRGCVEGDSFTGSEGGLLRWRRRRGWWLRRIGGRFLGRGAISFVPKGLDLRSLAGDFGIQFGNAIEVFVDLGSLDLEGARFEQWEQRLSDRVLLIVDLALEPPEIQFDLAPLGLALARRGQVAR